MQPSISTTVEHTLLKPDATEKEVKQLCEEARKYSFFGVCVNSSWLTFVKKTLTGSPVKIVCVVGFPLGNCTSETKAFEAKWCAENGADEIDMVIHLGLLKQKSEKEIVHDINLVCEACQKPVKVILETGLLDPDEIERACQYVLKSKAQFVKTSTGFLGPGASIETIQLMKKTVGQKLQIKASGGIKDLAQAKKMIAAGAARLGTSKGVAIMEGLQQEEGY